MINPKHFRELVVRQALKEINLWSEEAEELLMLTAAVESDLGTFLRQIGTDGGYAVGRGVFSIEPNTYQWMKDRFSGKYWPVFSGMGVEDLVTDLKFGAKVARLRYIIDPNALPIASDIEGLAKTWKRVYNGSVNGATWEEAKEKYFRLVKGK